MSNKESVVNDPLVGLPCVLDYLDYRQFLKAYLEALSKIDKKFSRRWVAKRAGFQSPQLLTMIASGQRRLGSEKASALAKVFKLEPLEAEYFLTIVELGETSDHRVQQSILEKINTSFRQGLFRQIDDRGKELFREWYLPALLELVGTHDFRNDAKWMATRLAVEVADVKAGLAVLEKGGFIEKHGRSYRRAHPSNHTLDQVYPVVLAKFHMQMLERSFKALAFPRDRRHFEGLTFSIPQKHYDQVVERIKRFVREVDGLAESLDDRDEVYQMQLCFFPLSQVRNETND